MNWGKHMGVDKDKEKAQVGVIVVTHVDYGAALLRAAEQILGPLSDCATIQVDVTLEVSETVKRLQEASALLDNGLGVMVLTDMFGGTPTNLSLSLLGKNGPNIEVVTGVNLPMLLKVFGSRGLPLPELAVLACEAGKEGILVAGDVLRGKTRKRECE